MKVLDYAPECPKAGDDGRQTHRNPAYDLAPVMVFHRALPLRPNVWLTRLAALEKNHRLNTLFAPRKYSPIGLAFGPNLFFLTEKVDQCIVCRPAIVAPGVTIVDFDVTQRIPLIQE